MIFSAEYFASKNNLCICSVTYAFGGVGGKELIYLKKSIFLELFWEQLYRIES